MASFLLHNPLIRLVSNLLTVLNVAVQFCLFIALFLATLGLRPSGRLAQILRRTVGDLTPPYVNETIQPPLLPREAAATLIQIIIILSLMILCASMAMYYRRRNDRIKADEQTKLASAMGGEVKKVDDSHVLPFKTLLLRNTLMAVLVVPLPVLLMYGMAFLTGGGLRTLPFWNTLREYRVIVEPVLTLAILASFALPFVWFGVAEKFVDIRLLKITRPRTQKDELAELYRLAGYTDVPIDDDDEAVPASVNGGCLARMGAAIRYSIQTIMWFVPIILLIGALAVIVDLLNLPSIIFYLGSVIIVLGSLYRSMTVGLEKPAQELYQTIEEELTKEYGADSVEVREFKESVKATENSTESHMMRYALIFMVVAMGLIFGGAIIAAELTTAAGGSPEDRKNAATAALVIGIVLLFIVLFLLSRFLPDSPGSNLHASATAAMMRMDYAEMIRLTEQFLSEVPNWESKSWAAIAYLFVRRFEDAERCIHEVLETAASMPDDQRVMMKPVAGQMRGVLASLRAAQGRYAEAEESVRMAITLDPDEPAHYNTLAEILMLQGRPADEAWTTLEEAGRLYGKAKRESSPTHHALRAWAWAMRGDSSQSDDEMLEAVTSVKQEEQAYLPEVYLTGARASLALGRRKAARASLKRAADVDPVGLNGVIAAELLATLS